jgi:hypothetical protein
MTGFKELGYIVNKYMNCVVLFLVLFSVTGTCQATLQKNLWPQWEVNNPLSKEVISHQLWDEFLKLHVITNEEGINVLSYASFSPKDRKLIKEYLKRMSEIDIDGYNRNEQLAYWINVYNALTIQTVASYYPIGNIQEINITPGLFSSGPWGGTLIHIKKSPLSLDDINNRIIRPIWNDPRTLYALTDATLGAPNMANRAYQGETINEQLNEAALSYVNSLRGVQVVEGKLIVSKLYDWYEEDFGDSKKNVIKHLSQFAKEPLHTQLKHINSIDSYIYNWHLNSPADSA